MKPLITIALSLFLCNIAYSQTRCHADSVYFSIFQQVINNSLMSVGISASDSASLVNSTKIENLSLKVYFENDLSMIVFSSQELDKIPIKNMKRLASKLEIYNEYLDKEKQLPFHLIEFIECKTEVRIKNKLISATYKLKATANSYTITDKKISLDYVCPCESW